jgi:prophage regulatory protein
MLNSDADFGNQATRHLARPIPDRLLRMREVMSIVGLGKTLIYRLIQDGDFPQPYKPGGYAVRWSENELIDWLAACATKRPS